MIVTLGAAAPQASLVDHLRRLGCTVTRVDAGTFDVCIAYPDTVDDEAAAADRVVPGLGGPAPTPGAGGHDAAGCLAQ